jgi:aryl-alcohol dehydrogenase-like predicted oxidoreductase
MGLETDLGSFERYAWDTGINSWDTANVYSNGERFVFSLFSGLWEPRSLEGLGFSDILDGQLTPRFDPSSEKICAMAMKKYNIPREQLVLMTKVFARTVGSRTPEPGYQTLTTDRVLILSTQATPESET